MFELKVKDSVEELVIKRDLCVAKVTQAFQLLDEARSLANEFAAPHGSYAFYKVLGYGEDRGAEQAEAIRQRVDREGWEYLAKASGLKNLMDAAGWKEFTDLLADDAVPLSIDNVYATFESFGQIKRHIFERGLVNVFRELSNNYVSNSPFSIGRRLILERAIEGHSYALVNREKLSDIDRILHIVNRRPPPDHLGDAAAALLDAHRKGERELVTDYLHLRWFKNGNVHVMIRKQQDIDRVNDLIASHYKNQLPDASA